ncbi:MAG: GNAT family N-acetyltransferase [Dehalobacterium sp.]
MSKALTPKYPTEYESWLTLKKGGKVFCRPILPTDGNLVVDLFNRLSPNSRYLRFLRHLHTFPQDMLYRFTHVNYSSEFALISMIKENGNDAIIAIARYAHSTEDNLTDLAVVVRDDWQNLGLGKSLLKRVVDIGKEHGIYRFGSMIEPQNKKIRQILSELGYTMKYSLKSGVYEVEILV